MEILCFASADYEEPNWVNAQHLMTRLAARHRILYVNSLGLRAPRADRRDARKILRRLAAVGRPLSHPRADLDLHVLSPLSLPPLRVPLASAVGARLVSAGVRRALGALRFRRPLTWIFLPSAAPLLTRLPLGPIVYHCVDAYEANPGVDARRVRRMEDEVLARARIVIAASEPLRARLAARHPRVRLMANVADLAAYPPPDLPPPEPPELAGVPRPRVGYLGNLAAYKVDLPLLARTARQRPDTAWIFIGAVGLGDAPTRLDALRSLPNVHLLGPQPRARLGTFLHHLDVGLIPFVDNETTRHSFPLKFFEYLACGIPVVTAALPALAAHCVPPLVYAYRDPEGFAAALDAALAARGAEAARQRRVLAEAHSWERRMEEIETLIEELASLRDR